MELILFIIYIIVSFVRAGIYTVSKKRPFPKTVIATSTVLHLLFSAAIAYIVMNNSSPGSSRYYLNGVNVTSLIDNPISTFFTMFVLFGSLFYFIPWGIMELVFSIRTSRRSGGGSKAGSVVIIVLSSLLAILGLGIVLYSAYFALIGQLFSESFFVGNMVFLMVGIVLLVGGLLLLRLGARKLKLHK